MVKLREKVTPLPCQVRYNLYELYNTNNTGFLVDLYNEYCHRVEQLFYHGKHRNLFRTGGWLSINRYYLPGLERGRNFAFTFEDHTTSAFTGFRPELRTVFKGFAVLFLTVNALTV